MIELKIRGLYLVSCLLAVGWHMLCVAYIDVPKIQQRTLSALLAKEGDINIGHLTDITTYSDATKTCGPTRGKRGCEAVEMAIYVVNEINRRSDLLPNITLGFVIADGCSLDRKGLEVVSYFVKDNDTCGESDQQHLNESLSAQKHTFSNELKSYDVIGIVGPQTSTIAKTVSTFMGVFEISMIGIRATSDELSDKSRYEYFVRLVSPDSRLVLPLVEFVKHYGWKYVSVIYTAGAYGENAFKQVSDLLNENFSRYGICIAVAHKFSTSAGQSEFEAVTDELVKNENARVVIAFLELVEVAQALFRTMLKKRELGTFIWLGADSMAAYELEPSMVNMLEGIIFLDHPAVTMPDFENYVGNVTPMSSQGNEWIMGIWEDKFNCTFDSTSSHLQTKKQCSEELNLDSTVCPLVPSQYNRVHDAYLVYAQAAHDHITTECPEGFKYKTLLKTCNWGEAFLQRIMTTTFQGVLGRIRFDENGDFQENFVLKQYYRSTYSRPIASKVVGFWNYTEAHLYIKESEINWKLFSKNGTSEDDLKPPISVCSQPCLRNQYMLIKQSQSCCWTCMSCRNNEIILENQTGCSACPMFTWPDDETARNCLPISPVYLEPSHIISVILLCLAIILILLSVICASVFLVNRQNKMLSKLNIKLNILIILGILVACVTVILLVVPPDASKRICAVRYAGFHIGINLIYSPLLVKNALICRFYFYRKNNFQGHQLISSESQMVFFGILLLCQVSVTLLIAALVK